MNEAVYKRVGPSNAARFAAELELFLPHQGYGDFRKTPLILEVSLGTQDFKDTEGFGFTLAFRSIILDITVENCQISRDYRYQRTLPKDIFIQYLKRVVDTSSSGEVKASGSASVGINKILSAIGIDISAHGEIAKRLQSGDTNTLEGYQAFKIVRYITAGRWQIGHPTIGDPTELDGLLRGSYLNLPPDDTPNEIENALCFLEPNNKLRYVATVEIRAKKDDCIYIPIGKKLPSESWEEKNRTAIERLMVLHMLEEQNTSDELYAPDGEVILSRAKIEIGKKRKAYHR